MRWLAVVFSCGHDGLIPFSGPYERGEEIANACRVLRACPDCREYRHRLEYLKRVSVATQAAAVCHLPPLRGSAFEIQWAIVLRDDALSSCADLYKRLEHEELGDARYWIDHRTDHQKP